VAQSVPPVLALEPEQVLEPVPVQVPVLAAVPVALQELAQAVLPVVLALALPHNCQPDSCLPVAEPVPPVPVPEPEPVLEPEREQVPVPVPVLAAAPVALQELAQAVLQAVLAVVLPHN
jgi:hypothetical protein